MKPLDDRLVGSWVTEYEDSNAIFIFRIEGDTFEVAGFDQSDGESFDIKDIAWDGTTLSFVATMPSTGFHSKNAFRIRPDGNAELELTLYEIWKKKA